MRRYPTRLIVVSISALLAGCWKSSPPLYGREYNAERVKRGITPIGSDWFNYNPWNNGGGAASWRPPESAAANGAYHSNKDVLYSGGQILSETDRYLSGRTLPSTSVKGGTDFEGAAITYSYIEERAGRDPWTCYGPTGKVSRAAFDAVLASWGLKE